MDIDWKILIAQIINFAILFFILKKFLYKPFFDLLEKRREKIQAGIDNSVKMSEKMAKLKEWKLAMEEKNKEDRTLLLSKAQSEIKERENQIIQEAEKKRLNILSKAEKEAKDIKERESDLSKKIIVESSFKLTEKLLKESIDKDRGRKISQDFLSNLKL